jgi:Flp pilus assembly protein TadG
MVRWRPRFLASCSGAVAPTVALSLFALIGAGGIAFDYARLATMDSELQNAADEAALAAATQLDGQYGAIERAIAAAENLLINETRFANDAQGRAVGDLSFTFYESYDAEADTTGSETRSSAEAKVVRVAVGGREAFYALTPIVGALSSGEITAEAFAGLTISRCKVPPLMICNPNPTGDPGFNGDHAGRGLRLTARQYPSDPYGPGNFGFLDTGFDMGGGAAVLRRALGQENFVQNCLASDNVISQPAAGAGALDAINARFDIYSTQVQNNTVCGDGQCPPSANVRKDLMRDGSGGGGGACKPAAEDAGQKGWKLLPAGGRYLPASNAVLTSGQRGALYPMGHPRDICHALSAPGVCAGGRLGTGIWDRAAYFHSNYGANFPWAATSALGPRATRYQTYLWELKNQLAAVPSGLNARFAVPGGAGRLHNKPVCQPAGAVTPIGDIDRRRLTVAVVNCTGADASPVKKRLEPVKWIDIFLVEPSWNRDRTTDNDLYVEIIGEARMTGPGGTANQVERAVPYLIR